jgi:pimeloyl-ACP methyl ester carboxylesterase
MTGWIKETRALPFQEFSVTSFDGLKLKAKYYECRPGAPIELMFHGYRGYAERDLCGGVQRCFALEHNAFIVDLRASGDSDGNVITFGINESKDCLAWLDLMIGHFGPDVKIILTGISMGASTVLNAAGSELPENVVGVLADCGFTSPAQIIKKVIGDMGLPKELSYPFVKLGAQLYGKFDLEEIASVDAIRNCKVPVIFFHGEDDAYVPCEMSRINYEACPTKKRLVTIPGAGHGLCYPVAPGTRRTAVLSASQGRLRRHSSGN